MSTRTVRSERPSLRRGLPYGWWRRRAFKGALAFLTTAALLGATMGLALALTLEYWTG